MQVKKSKSTGFTLVELLIVIIIIGILAAIAFVAYTGSQNKAHKADAQSTLAQIRNKLGEYNADQGYYPASQDTLNTWMAGDTGGNNDALAAKFVAGNGYTYTASPAGCDNTATPCTGYTASAAASIFSGDAPINVTN